MRFKRLLMTGLTSLLAVGCGPNTPPPAEFAPQVLPEAAATPRHILPAHADGLSFADPFEIEPQTPPANVFGEFPGHSRPQTIGRGLTGLTQHTHLDEGFDSDIAVCPQGKWIAFASTRHSMRTDIYLQRVDGRSVTQLTTDPADDAFPAFSPDGKHIAFASNRTGNWNLYLTDINGQGVVQLTSGPQQDIAPSFSPCGRRLVYSSTGTRSGQWELWTLEIETGQRRMIGFGLFPNWSARTDKDIIVYQRARQRGSRWFSIWTLELVDGEARRPTEIAVSANAALVCPKWSPDGTKIVFASVIEPAADTHGRLAGQQDIWVTDADGSNRQRLTDGLGINATPAWGRDGRVFFVSDRGGAETIWSVRAATPVTQTAAVTE